MIIALENLLTPDEIARMLALMDEAHYVPGHELSGPRTAPLKHNLQMPWSEATAATLNDVTQTALARSLAYDMAALPLRSSVPLFTQYRTGMYYREHIDAPVIHHSQGVNRSDVSATLFLSAPESYGGGELQIDSDMGKAAVKCAAGTLLLYPSTALHGVAEVTHGVRSVAIFWIQSKIRDAMQRRILFDLWRTLESLRSRPDSTYAERESINTIYSNLMRMWAEL